MGDVLQAARPPTVPSFFKFFPPLVRSFLIFLHLLDVSPSPSPSVDWLIPSIIRRIRTRLPTCLSIGLGAFLASCFTVPPNYYRRGRAGSLRRRGGPSREKPPPTLWAQNQPRRASRRCLRQS